MDLGGVEGGEGNRVGTRDEGEEGSLGEERGKNMRGWMGERGVGDTCLAGEEGARGEEGFGDDTVGDSGEGWEVGEEEVVQVSRVEGREGEVGSGDKPGAGGSSTSGHTGSVGEAHNGSKLVGAEGGRWSKAVNAWPSSVG